MNDLETVDSILRVTLNRNLLKYAVGRAMFCPACGKSLDCRTAVTWTYRNPATGTERDFVACGSCYDSRVAGRQTTVGGETLDIVDGRKLWPARTPEPKRPPVRNVAHRADLHVGDRVEVRLSGRFTTVRIIGERSTISHGYAGERTVYRFLGINERTGREVRFTAAKVRQIIECGNLDPERTCCTEYERS